ncbi:MAG: amino acid adenylation domain-containing protein [Oscillospiraceae bacterium]
MHNVIEYLIASAEERPDAVALSDGERELSFAALRRMVWGLGEKLLADGVAGQPVGVYAQRRVEVIAAMLGCAAAGCCYVPLNPEAPAEKNQKIIRHAGIKTILGFDDGEYDGADCGCSYERLDGAFPESGERPAVEISGADTLYIIYTSGSTGEPKGIRKSHGSVVDFVEAYVKELGFGPEEVIGNQTPFCFDASAKDIYLMLRTGARMEIIPSVKFAFPVQLIEYLNEKRVTFLSWVPSALAIVARLRTFRDILPETVRRVAFVGEVFPIKDLQAWRDALPEIEYINLYGSSELAGVAALYHIPADQPLPAALPIGKPLGNSRIYLMEDGKLVPDRGEMLVASAALADEYLNAPEKTAAAFEVIDIDGVPTRVLHTGDWARYDGEGNLVFLARSDAQIKYKGYRIELGEIEAAINTLAFIDRACVLYNAERERITAFVTTRQPELKLRDLNAALDGKLVDYMLPRRLVVLEEMPLNANGKIDRPYLKTML